MLTEQDIKVLKQQMVPAEDIANIVSYEPRTQTVTFSDGTQRTVCEVWCRTMGYYRPASFYNNGKKSEFTERKWFTEDNANRQLKAA